MADSDPLSRTGRFPSPPYVLVIDDDDGLREIVSGLLESEGYEVVQAADGRAALELLRAAAILPFAIVLDLNMPIMNGWQTLAALRADFRLGATPVLVMTAEPAHRRGDLPGASAVLLKPLDAEELLAALDEASRAATESRRFASAHDAPAAHVSAPRPRKVPLRPDPVGQDPGCTARLLVHLSRSAEAMGVAPRHRLELLRRVVAPRRSRGRWGLSSRCPPIRRARSNG